MFFPRFLFSLGCVVLLATPLHAQRPSRQLPPPPPPPSGTPPALPFPTVAPAMPGVPPALSGAPAAAPGSPDEPVKLQFPNGLVTDILDYYGVLTGKRILPDNQVQGTLNLNVTGSVPKSEAIRIIEVALTLNGFSLIPDDGNIVKVLGLGKNSRSAGVPIFTELEQLPPGSQIVSYLVRMRYLDPLETAGVLQQYVPPGNSVAFTALEKAGALIITDDSSSVRRLVELVSSLDQPLAPLTEKFVRLERADATKAIEFLNSVFESKSSGGGQAAAPAPIANPAVRRPIRRVDEAGQPVMDIPQVPGTAGQLTLSGDSIIQGRITLTADVRTNRVHIVTNPINMPLVEKLLEEYDTDTPFATPVPRALKFVNAADVLPILVQALSEPGSDGNGASAGAPGAAGSTPSRNAGSSNPGSTGSSGFNSNGSSFGGSGGSGGSSDIGNGELNTQAVDTKPTIAVVGSTKIIADSRINAVIILGNREARDKVFAVLDRLDVRAPQVVIRTVIGELSLDNNHELGFNYLLRTNRGSLLTQYNAGFLPTASTSTTGSDGTPVTNSNATALNSFTTLASGLAQNFSGVGGIITIGKSFDIILSALESTNRFKTISRPMIFTSNNKEAIIASGQEIAVPTSSISSVATSGTSTGLTSNVEFKNVVLQLEVVPLINSENEVTLDIVQKIDSLVAGSSTTVNGTVVPTIATRKLKSTVSAPNNSTIVLGGLITQNESKTDGNIPYLSRIPVLGNLFRSRARDAGRSELIILLHPEVVNTAALLASVRANEERRTYLGGGLEEQLLPNEVRKATAVTTTTTTTTTVAPTPTPGSKEVVTRKRTAPATKTTTTTVRRTTTGGTVKQSGSLVDPYH